MSEIVLISPPLIAYKNDIFGLIPSPPVGVASIAAYVKSHGYEVQGLDCLAEGCDSASMYRDDFTKIGIGIDSTLNQIDRSVLLVGISVHSAMVAPFCLELALKIQTVLHIPVMVGGPHITLNSQDFLNKGVAFAICGEGEGAVLKLLQEIKASGKKKEGSKKHSSVNSQKIEAVHVDIDSLPIPCWETFTLEPYWKMAMNHSPFKGRFAPIITSRGCPYNCAFCTTPKTSNRRWRARSPESVVAEVEFLNFKYGITDVFIQDDNFTADPKRAIAICKKLIDANIGTRLSLPSGVRMENLSAPLLKYMAEAGFIYLCMAPESGSSKVRDLMQKPLNKVSLYKCQKTCKSLKIRTGAFFIIGTPGERITDILKTAFMITKLLLFGCDDVSIFIYSPLPGSSMAEKFTQPLPKDNLGLCWSPRWRKDYSYLSWIRIGLYCIYSFLKVAFQPFAIPRHLINIFTNRFETKGEMGVARLIRIHLPCVTNIFRDGNRRY